MTANSTPVFELTPVIGAALLQVGDSSLVAPTSYQALCPVAPAAGTRIDQLDISGVAATTATILRLFEYDGTTLGLLHELALAAGSAPSASVIPGEFHENQFTRPDIFPIVLPLNSQLVATVNDTQLVTEVSVNSIAASQTPSGAGTLVNLNGASVTAASTTAVASSAAGTAGVPMTLTSTPYVFTNPARLSLTAAGASGASFTILGRTAAGALISEVLVGPNTNTVYSVNIYKAVYAIIPSVNTTSNTSAGYSTSVGTAILSIPSKVMITSGINISATNFTLTGMGPSGAALTEVLAGPNVGSAQSVNTYAALFTVSQSGTPAGALTIGNPPILGGFRVLVRGGNLQ